MEDLTDAECEEIYVAARYTASGARGDIREITRYIYAAGAASVPVPPSVQAVPREARTPKDIVARLGVQQAARVAASLRGDKGVQRAAEHWLGLIALDHWHEIIADLNAAIAQEKP